jgi:hypothetical protein
MMPIIYTPTEGDAISNFSGLFRRPEGCYLNINDVDRVSNDLSKWSGEEHIDLIVVSDGEQVSGSSVTIGLLTVQPDFGDWRPRNWRHLDFRGQADVVFLVRRHQSHAHTAGGIGHWNQCEFERYAFLLNNSQPSRMKNCFQMNCILV